MVVVIVVVVVCVARRVIEEGQLSIRYVGVLNVPKGTVCTNKDIQAQAIFCVACKTRHGVFVLGWRPGKKLSTFELMPFVVSLSHCQP